MTEGTGRKIRSEDTWDEVRRAWEGGETGASLARRYDVGLANLWRRRASEGWERRQEPDPAPEPPEGWDRYAERELDRFEARLKAERTLAMDLVRVMQGGPIGEAPLWHATFLYDWRARHLGAEVAAADRERARAHPWADALWADDGRLKPLHQTDAIMLMLHRDVWREQVGLPKGAAEGVP